MRTWRLLLDVDGQVWTFLVAARDHLQAWWLVNHCLAPARRPGATLEELEATEVPSRGPARVLAAWLGAPLPALSTEGIGRTG
jgi:hypothetical protein